MNNNGGIYETKKEMVVGKPQLKVDNSNYFSPEANMEYMGASQFKDFKECEVHALAKLKGEYVEEKSKALMVGSYVDAYFSGEMEQFKLENPQIFKKDGTLLKDFEKANEIIEAINNDPLMLKYLSGQHQVVMTGKIAGVNFKIKVDSLLDNVIVDQKIMSSIRELTWKYDEETKRNKQLDFVEAFGYDIQGAIYQEIVFQNTGKKLPFVLAVATKEEGVDKALIQIDQEYLDKALALVKELAPRYDLIKKGVIEPVGCGKCPSCRKARKCEEVVSYKDFFQKGEDENA